MTLPVWMVNPYVTVSAGGATVLGNGGGQPTAYTVQRFDSSVATNQGISGKPDSAGGGFIGLIEENKLANVLFGDFHDANYFAYCPGAGGGTIFVFEQGVNNYTGPVWAPGDTVSVVNNARVVVYSLNGTPFYTSANASTGILRGAYSTYNTQGGFTAVSLSGLQASTVLSIAHTALTGADHADLAYAVNAADLVSWQGSPLIGSGTLANVVTSTGSGATPPTNCTIAPSVPPYPALIDYDGVHMKIYTVTPGGAALDTVKLYVSTDGGATWALDSSQTTNPINYSILTFSGTDGFGSFAINHGWTLNGTDLYRIRVTDVSGLYVESDGMLMVGQSQYTCTIHGKVSDLSLIGQTITLAIPSISFAGLVEYLPASYPITIGALGAWVSPALPRHTPFNITFPNTKLVSKTTPSAASADYATL